MIGVFDSGVGGLTVLSAMRARCPQIDVVYFGDTKNAPYGPRTREDLSNLTVAGIQFLIDHGATSIVSACNSVSASLALSVLNDLAIAPSRMIEMTGPCVSAFKDSPDRIALCATQATVLSSMYQNGFRMIGKDIQAFPIHELAGAIERGADEEACEGYIREAFSAIAPDSYDTLILGCTHYPLALDAFRRVVGEKRIYDPAEAVAERVERDLAAHEPGTGKTTFYISKETEQFRSLVARLFPDEVMRIEVV